MGWTIAAKAISHGDCVGVSVMSTVNGLPRKVSPLPIYSIMLGYEKAARMVVSDKYNGS